MTHEAIALWTETSSDPELIAGVRAGDGTAFGVLYERHVDAARKVAAQYTNSAVDVDDVVAESFSRVLRALQRGDGPDLAFRAYLFTIVRRTGMDTIARGNRTRPGEDMAHYEAALGYEAPSDEGALVGFEQGIVAEAFRSLPERWQAVLWYTEVEKKSPKEIAPLLGLTANGVAALAYRAREALRQAYLQQHLNTSESLDCLAAAAQLGAYVRGGLAKREHVKVDDHVRSCEKCSALVAELEDVNRGMRGVIAPLVLGVLGVGALEGGLPIGGIFGAGEAAGAAGASGGAAASGGSMSGISAAGSGLTAWIGTATSVVLPAAAAIGIVALVVSGASYLGVFNPLGSGDGTASNPNPTAEPGPTADPVPSPSPSEAPTASPSPEPSAEPTVAPTVDPSPAPVDDDNAPDNTAGGTPGGTIVDPSPRPTTDPTTEPSPNPTTDPDPDPSPDPTTDPDPDPTTDPSPDPTTDPDPDPTTDPDPDPKTASLSFKQAPLEYLEISASSPNVGVELGNSGESDAEDVTASITLPDGLAFATPPGGGSSLSVTPAQRLADFLRYAQTSSLAAGDWDCTLSDEQRVATCSIDSLAAGTEASLGLELAPIANGTDLGDNAWTEFTASSGDVSASYRVRTGLKASDSELETEYVDSGHVAATQVGATLMSCKLNSAACRTVMSATGSDAKGEWNNNNQKMEPINSAGGTTNSAATNLSTAFLPEGATVKFALLEWSASREARNGEWTGDPASARFRVPGGTYAPISADTTDSRQVDDKVLYQSRADITDLVKNAGRGEYALADIALGATDKHPSSEIYGGFSITVIYELASLPESRVALFTGSQWVDNDHAADFSFFTEGSSSVTLGWTTWEGDRGFPGDMARIDGDNFTPLGWSGSATFTANSGNAADSTAFGGTWANTLGVDAKSFASKQIQPGRHTIRVTTNNDTFLIGSLTVTVTSAR